MYRAKIILIMNNNSIAEFFHMLLKYRNSYFYPSYTSKNWRCIVSCLSKIYL